jgi:hypothetical protein
MKNEAQKLFEAAEAQDVGMKVYYPGESPDYEGTSAKLAWDAASACDEMHVSFHKDGEARGWALIIPGLDPDEVVADYSGDWIENALKA